MDQNTPAEFSQYKSCHQPPEISIEWRDVEIEVKVLGVDLPPQEFVRYTINISICRIAHDFSIQVISDPRRASVECRGDGCLQESSKRKETEGEIQREDASQTIKKT